MLARTVLTAGLALLVGLPSASAAPKPQITDPTGDYKVAAVGDIVSVTFSTLPKGAKEVLQLDMVLAAAPATTTPFTYSVNFTADTCNFTATYFGHPLEGVFSTSAVGCQPSPPAGQVKISGTHVIWTVPLTGKIKRGALLEMLKASTVPGGAVSGGAAMAAGDTATGLDEWVVGSDRPLKKKK